MITKDRLLALVKQVQPRDLSIRKALLLWLNPKKYSRTPLDLNSSEFLEILALAAKGLSVKESE